MFFCFASSFLLVINAKIEKHKIPIETMLTQIKNATNLKKALSICKSYKFVMWFEVKASRVYGRYV